MLTSISKKIDETATNGKATMRPFIEYPAKPLSDEDRDVFLGLLDSDEAPNEALGAAAEEFKRQLPNK